MSNWFKDQFLQTPEPDPWIEWTLDDLERAANSKDYPTETRQKIRVELKARRQGKRLADNPEATP